MRSLGDVIQQADWKAEKHVPVIECPEAVHAGELFAVKATLGKAVAHPNTTEHHIRWIQLFFLPDGARAPCQVGSFEFAAHGESVEGPNQGSIFTNPEVTISLRTSRPGTLQARPTATSMVSGSRPRKSVLSEPGDRHALNTPPRSTATR